MSKAKIVAFKDGKFGIRKWSWLLFRYVFLDLINSVEIWRTTKNNWFAQCRRPLEEVKSIFDKYNKPVSGYNVKKDKGELWMGQIQGEHDEK